MRFTHWHHHHRWNDWDDDYDLGYDYEPEWQDNSWYSRASYGGWRGGWRGWY